MSKRKRTTTRIPDAINKSIGKNFTTIPNDVLRNPEMSAKAKNILCILLSNKDGWISYFTVIQSMMKEGETAIANGIKELQDAGYLMKVRYRDKQTKKVKGSFWAYTDQAFNFHNMEESITTLEKYGLEPMPNDINKQSDFHQGGNPGDGNPEDGNQELIRLNNNNTKSNNNNIIPTNKFVGNESEENNPNNSLDGNKKPSIKERNKQYLPLANMLARIIQTNKNIKHTTSQLNTWANEIRQLEENNGISYHRIKDALRWYKKNIGGEFIPVIESGNSLRNKFMKLEWAMKNKNKKNGGTKLQTGYMPKEGYKHRKADKTV